MEKLLIPYNKFINIISEQVQYIISEAKNRENIIKAIHQKFSRYFMSHYIDSAIDLDKSPNLKLAQWILSAAKYDGWDDIPVDELWQMCEAAEKGEFQPFKYKSIEEALNDYNKYAQNSLLKDDYEVIYEDSKWTVYVPNTYEASRHILYDIIEIETSWCTAANSNSGRSHFYDYTYNKNRLFILYNKEQHQVYQWNTYKPEEFNNSANKTIDPNEINLTKGLINFIKNDTGYDLTHLSDDNREWILNGRAYLEEDNVGYYTLYYEDGVAVNHNLFTDYIIEINLPRVCIAKSEEKLYIITYNSYNYTIDSSQIEGYINNDNYLTCYDENGYVYDLNKHDGEITTSRICNIDCGIEKLGQYYLLSDQGTIYASGIGNITDCAVLDDNHKPYVSDKILFFFELDEDNNTIIQCKYDYDSNKKVY